MRWFVLLLLLLPVVLASPYDTRHLTILAVSEDGVTGSTADLYLELRDGSGRVFLDTKPLTKIDTQVSTRYARDIACDYYDLDCSKYDFIYTIIKLYNSQEVNRDFLVLCILNYHSHATLQ